jgi:prepilin-type N-terminal cleavage/methylation domain-containing protein
LNIPRRTRRRRAFVLIELLIAVALFGLFAAVVVRMISLSLRVANEVERADEAHRSFDAALARLRADAWNTAAIEGHIAAGVSLNTSGSTVVNWAIEADGTMSRTERRAGSDPARQAWRGAGEGVTFRSDDSAVVLEANSLRGSDAGLYRLRSLILERKGHQ